MAARLELDLAFKLPISGTTFSHSGGRPLPPVPLAFLTSVATGWKLDRLICGFTRFIGLPRLVSVQKHTQS